MLVENRGDVVILAPRHRVDTNNSPEVEKVVFENIGNGDGRVVIDFSQVEYVSSAGLRVLLATAKRLRSKGTLRLYGLNDSVQEVFDVSGFSTIIPIFDDQASALTG